MQRRYSAIRIITLLKVGAFAASALATTAPPAPRLIVAISVDQFSAALFDQYRGRFTGGLKKMQGGVVFPNGFQSHAATETCPGHSTLLTGRHPAATGIVANTWYDRAAATQVYCLADPAGPVPNRPDAPRGPANLKVPTLGEWLKAANPASRTFAVSGKDRGAITMAGHGADGTFWWGRYARRLHHLCPGRHDRGGAAGPGRRVQQGAVRRVVEEGSSVDPARSELRAARGRRAALCPADDRPSGSPARLDRPRPRHRLRPRSLLPGVVPRLANVRPDRARPRREADRHAEARSGCGNRRARHQPQRDRLCRPPLRGGERRAVRQPRPPRRRARGRSSPGSPRSSCRSSSC